MMKNTLKTLSRFAVCLMMIGAVACSDDEPGGGGPGGGEGGGGEGEGGGPSTPELTEGRLTYAGGLFVARLPKRIPYRAGGRADGNGLFIVSACLFGVFSCCFCPENEIYLS